MIDVVRKDDMKDILNIWLECNIDAHSFIDKEYWIANVDKVKNELMPESENYKIIIDTQIAGFVSIVNRNYIGALYISKDFQGQGYGKQLLEFCVKKYRHLTLNVYVKNKRAVEFYKRNGFTILREMSSNGENAYIMNVDYDGPENKNVNISTGKYSFF